MILLLTYLGGCVEQPQRPAPALPSASAVLAAATQVVDCEWAAADRYDDRRTSIANLAARVMAICGPQRMQMRRTSGLLLGLSPLQQSILDADEYQQAVQAVEDARKHRMNSN